MQINFIAACAANSAEIGVWGAFWFGDSTTAFKERASQVAQIVRPETTQLGGLVLLPRGSVKGHQRKVGIPRPFFRCAPIPAVRGNGPESTLRSHSRPHRQSIGTFAPD